jgi:hypothetical protein
MVRVMVKYGTMAVSGLLIGCRMLRLMREKLQKELGYYIGAIIHLVLNNLTFMRVTIKSIWMKCGRATVVLEILSLMTRKFVKLNSSEFRTS